MRAPNRLSSETRQEEPGSQRVLSKGEPIQNQRRCTGMETPGDQVLGVRYVERF
jgi:hypothetical protein